MSKAADPYFFLILEAIDHIESYCPETEEVFLSEPMAQDAIIMRLQSIGEYLKHLRSIDAERFDQQAPRSWHQVIGLRNRISHGYNRVDQRAIWQVITTELPEFRRSIEVAQADY